jgi:hypothetical protein
VVRVPAAIVPDRGADALRQSVQVGDQCLDRLALMIGMILERGVQIVDIGRMVLVVMDLHRLGVDVRFEGPEIIG